MRYQAKLIFSFLLALIGVLLVFAPLSWVLWKESIVAEEERVEAASRALGERTERLIVEAIEMLDGLNESPWVACSEPHLQAMHDAAIVRPYIKSIGHWRANERLCGAGFIQTRELQPPRADRIYDSGVIAWWPGEDTTVAGIALFMIRFGDHDVAMDPRMLLDFAALEDRRAGLWVEGLRMAVKPPNAELPDPRTLPTGLTVDRANNRIVSRFSLGTVFPIDIVVSEPLGQFWSRYLPSLATTAASGLVLIVVWILLVARYSRARFSLTGELREAIAKNRLRVDYQPIVELESGRCVGAEALARWDRDNGDVIGPDVFISVAEEGGLLPQLTRCVMAVALREIGEVLRENPDVSININLGAEDLENKDFLPALKQGLESVKLGPDRVKLEITERSLINSETVRGLIESLRREGHQVAIDDFGTGYSSLSYLESFDLDILKIDKAFVDAIEKEAVTSSVITHVIEMAKSLDLDMVAEGIETEHQVKWLLDRGVAYGQGYLFSKPLSARRFAQFIRSRRITRPIPIRADVG